MLCKLGPTRFRGHRKCLRVKLVVKHLQKVRQQNLLSRNEPPGALWWQLTKRLPSTRIGRWRWALRATSLSFACFMVEGYEDVQSPPQWLNRWVRGCGEWDWRWSGSGWVICGAMRLRCLWHCSTHWAKEHHIIVRRQAIHLLPHPHLWGTASVWAGYACFVCACWTVDAIVSCEPRGDDWVQFIWW